MQLLNELLDLRAKSVLRLLEEQAQTELDQLLEDLGNLRKAGLGRMINSFKQSYRFVDNGRRGYSKINGPRTGDVGKGFNSRVIGVARDSEVIEVKGGVRNWAFVKKAYRDNATDKSNKPAIAAASFYVDGKAIALLIMTADTITGGKNVAGVSWDFSGVADEDEVKELTSGLYMDHAYDGASRYGISGEEKPNPKSSEIKQTTKKGYSDDAGVEIKHYNGIGVQIKNVSGFVDRMVELFGTRLTMKLITMDPGAGEKRNSRAENRPIARADVKLFKDDIKQRLAKYRLEKAPTAKNVEELANLIFNAAVKKIKWSGKVYTSKPGTNWNYTGSGAVEKLFHGEEVAISFEGDRTINKYNSDALKLVIKLVGREIKPVSVEYRDEKGDLKSETF